MIDSTVLDPSLFPFDAEICGSLPILWMPSCARNDYDQNWQWAIEKAVAFHREMSLLYLPE